jgi:hypothetical protein
MIELKVTMQQMTRVLRALEDLKQTVLRKNPTLFATMAEAYLDDLDRLRAEIDELLVGLKSAG